MISFFKKIRQISLAKNRFSNYLVYALGEIILVVIGILLALKINNWNQDRKNATQEQRILQDILKNLERNQFLKERGVITWQDVISTADSLLQVMHHPTQRPSNEQLDLMIHKLTINWSSATSVTMYDVLSGSGDLGLVSSALIRSKLADYKANMEFLIKFEDVQSRFVDQQLRPFLNRFVDRGVFRSSIQKGELVITRNQPLFTSSYDELLRSREFANLLEDLTIFTRKLIGVYGRLGNDMEQIDSLILLAYPSQEIKTYVPY
ncbi:MAG: hypothetical protein KDC59_21055 [Saprospiraceae bacterium]|nr:hypothetical protein [Saprospiraceae bacterium]HPG09024.1 DUF6090 family protein [Saprospiraceae bacterium]